MKLTYAELSYTGLRPQNEDFVLFWEPEPEKEKEVRGSIALLADGLGGHGNGEVASHLAVTTALEAFRKAEASTTGNQLLWRLFNEANLAVYDAGMHGDNPTPRMATTLTVSLFRQNEVAVGHVGDSRAYLVRQGQIRQLTADHTYVAMQVKMNLISKEEAMSSDLRTMLTRSVGQNPTVQIDYSRAILRDHDIVVQCSDGLHNCLAEHELRDTVNRLPPADACDQLVRIAEKRGSQDNISVQVIRIEGVPRVGYYRGRVAYSAPAAATPAPSQELQVGNLLDERFQITGVINRSAMSSVFKANDLKTGSPVALKVPLPSLEGDPAAFARFQREEEIGRTLDHPSILKIIPVEDSEKSRPYIVMELLDGQTLEKLMQQIRPLPAADALPIVSQICDGLQYLHSQGVVHRDMKPQNIMLCSDGSLRIMDFGIAKAAASRRITFGGFSPTMGTPDYMAPEQVKGQRGDERTDIYSLGAILYEMLTGRVPFEGETAYMIMNARLIGDPVAPRVRQPDITPQIEEIVLRAMARDPDERFQSAAEMKAALDAPEEVELTGRAERLQPPVIWRSRWRSLRIVAISILIPVILFYLFFLMFSRR